MVQSKQPILAIDPGNIQSAYCIIDSETYKPYVHKKLDNQELLDILWGRSHNCDPVILEGISSYGGKVGKSIFDTLFWSGRFYEAASKTCFHAPDRILRVSVRSHICGNVNHGDKDIRKALIERFAAHDRKNGKGTKNNPDWFYGFANDEWAAYAVGVTYLDTHKE